MLELSLPGFDYKVKKQNGTVPEEVCGPDA